MTSQISFKKLDDTTYQSKIIKSRITLRQFEDRAYEAQNMGPGNRLIFGAGNQGTGKQLNQKTWQTFNQAYIDFFGQEKFNWVCRRYQFNARKMEREGRPLLPEHVELFSIGASQQLKSDIERTAQRVWSSGLSSSEKIKLEELSRSQLALVLDETHPFRDRLGKHLDPMDISGAPTEHRARYVHDPLLMDLEKQRLLKNVPQSYLGWLERFDKSVVSRELIENEIIPVPGTNGLDYYRVYKEISVGSGLIAYALIPATHDSSLRPHLAFRSTQISFSRKDVFQTVFQDLESDLGSSGYIAAKPLIDQLMRDPQFLPPGQMMDLSGYSLGATQAMRTLVDHHPRIARATFYSGPAIDSATADRFAEDLNRNAGRRREDLNISYYWIEGDFCPLTGQKHAGCGVNHPRVNIELFKIDRGVEGEGALDLHGFRYYDNNQMDDNLRVRTIRHPTLLLAELDNTQRDDRTRWYENMRQTFGKVIAGFLYCIYLLISGFENIFGLRILRRTNDRH